MKYLLMLFADEQVGSQIPPADMNKFMDLMYAYEAALTKAGVHVANSALQPTWEAKTIHVDEGEIKVQDGPYAEAREQLGGYYIIECEDMNAAVGWAAQCPAATWGHIEVRPYNQHFRE